MGALSTPATGEGNRHDGQLTFVGHVLADLPVDIKIGKLLIYGHVFGVLEECLIIGKLCVFKNRTKHFKKFAYTSIKKTHMYMCCEWHWFALYLNSFIGAAMSLKSLFSKPYKAHLESYRYVTYKCMYRVYRLKYQKFICYEHCGCLIILMSIVIITLVINDI